MSSVSAWASLLVFFLVADCAHAAPGPATKPVRAQPSWRERQAEAEEFFSKGSIPRIHIEVDAVGMKSLRQNVSNASPASPARAYVHATVRESAPGQPERVYTDVGIHIKGALGSFRAVDDYPSLTLNFDKFVRETRFHGLTKAHLNNSVQDVSYMEENLGGAILRDAGLAGPRVTNARVWLNSRHLGLYVLIEGHNKAFIHRFFGHTVGDLFDGGFVKDIDQDFSKTIDDPDDPCDPRKLMEAVREPNPALRRQKIEKILDVDLFYTFMAVEGLFASWDGYCFNHNNYRIYHNPRTDKFVFLARGMDQLFRNDRHPLIGGAIMCQAVFQTPDDRARYMQRVLEVRQKCFDPEKLNRYIDAMAARIVPVMAEIGPDAVRQFRDQPAELKARVRNRVRNVDRMLSIPNQALTFDPAGVASPKGWVGQGEATAVMDRVQEGGKPLLRIRVNGLSPGSFRTTVALARGRYTFQGLGRVANVIAPAGENNGAALRISGGRRPAGIVAPGAPLAHLNVTPAP